MVTGDDVRRFALSLPRTEERWVKDRVKFKVGRLVYATLSPDEKSMGFGFPKEERAALVAADRTSSTCRRRGIFATTGCEYGSPRLTRPRCASSCLTRGACAYPRRSALTMTAPSNPAKPAKRQA